MTPNTRFILVQDIGNLINGTIDEIKRLFREHRIDFTDIDLFYEWSINEILTMDYHIKVVGHYRNDVFKVIFSFIGPVVQQHLRVAANASDMAMLRGAEVRTLVNGRDLFITSRTRYY